MGAKLKELRRAIKTGKVGSIRSYLDKNSATLEDMINLKNDLNETPLICAIRLGFTDIAKYFLNEAKVSLDLFIQSYQCGTPLVAAVFLENIPLVELLIEKEKAQEGVFSPDKHPGLLLTAIRRNNQMLTRLLIEEKVDINSTGQTNYEKPPYWFEASEATPFDTYGPNVFELPIITAMQDNYTKVLSLLIQYNPSLEKKGSAGYSAKDLLKSKRLKKEIMDFFSASRSLPSARFFTPCPDNRLTAYDSRIIGNSGYNFICGTSAGKASQVPVDIDSRQVIML